MDVGTVHLSRFAAHVEEQRDSKGQHGDGEHKHILFLKRPLDIFCINVRYFCTDRHPAGI